MIGAKGSINSQPTHPSLILYTALAQTLYFDESRQLDVREDLISYLNRNLNELAQAYFSEVTPGQK